MLNFRSLADFLGAATGVGTAALVDGSVAALVDGSVAALVDGSVALSLFGTSSSTLGSLVDGRGTVDLVFLLKL